MQTTFYVLAYLGILAGVVNLPAGLAVMATSLLMASRAHD